MRKELLYGCVYPFLFIEMNFIFWGYTGDFSLPTPPPCRWIYGLCTCFYSLAENFCNNAFHFYYYLCEICYSDLWSPWGPCAGTDFEFPPSTASHEVMSQNRVRKSTVSLHLESFHGPEETVICMTAMFKEWNLDQGGPCLRRVRKGSVPKEQQSHWREMSEVTPEISGRVLSSTKKTLQTM